MATARTTSRPTRPRSVSATGRSPSRGGQAPTRRRPPARRRRRRAGPGKAAARWWPALLVAAAVLVGLAWDTESRGVPGQCTVAGSAVTFTPDQVANARTIDAVARERGLPDRAVVIALATAHQESRLRNLDYGDRDSLGLFQQRPSQGWGSPEQVQDPVYAAGKFYDGLVQVPAWETGRLTDVAQAVQRSGFPEAYQQWSPLGEQLTAAIASADPASIVCP